VLALLIGSQSNITVDNVRTFSSAASVISQTARIVGCNREPAACDASTGPRTMFKYIDEEENVDGKLLTESAGSGCECASR
jgi:hypothetical protein